MTKTFYEKKIGVKYRVTFEPAKGVLTLYSRDHAIAFYQQNLEAYKDLFGSEQIRIIMKKNNLNGVFWKPMSNYEINPNYKEPPVISGKVLY